jgi:hypothetical protein
MHGREIEREENRKKKDFNITIKKYEDTFMWKALIRIETRMVV